MPQVQTQFVGSDVAPGLPMDNAPTLAFANRESSSDFRDIATFPAGKHVPHHMDCQRVEFGCSVINSSCVIAVPACTRANDFATLGNHIPHVVELSAKKQMVRVDAKSNIATVADVHAFRYGAIEHLVRYSVRYGVAFIFSTPYQSIPISASAKPDPTSRLGNRDVFLGKCGAFH